MKRKRNKLTKEQREALHNDILENPDKSYNSIAKEHGVSQPYVSTIARRLGMKPRVFEGLPEKKWTGEAIDKFLISQGSTIRRRTIKFQNVKSRIRWGCTLCNQEWMASFDYLLSRFREYQNLKGCPNCGYNNFTIYHDFLNELTPESAYFLGVFHARGTIKKNKSLRNINIEITSHSHENLNKLQSLMGGNIPVINITENLYKLRIKSPQMLQKLREYGSVNSNYTKCKGTPVVISKNKQFFSDFLRGYMDCVGYVEILKQQKTNYTGARVSISASPLLIKDIKAFCKKELKLKKTPGYVTERREGVTELHFTGNYLAYNFLKITYNSTVSPIKYMSTKNYNKFISIQHALIKRAERNKLVRDLADEYTELKKETKKYGVPQIAKDHGVSINAVRKIGNNEIPKRLKPEKVSQIMEAYQKFQDLKNEARKVEEKAITLTGVSKTTFYTLTDGKWKKKEKYSKRVEEVEL